MYQQEDSRTQQDGQRPAEDSVEALVGHVLAVLHHPLTPRDFYLEVVRGLDIISHGTKALAQPECVRHVMAAAVERQQRLGSGQREDEGAGGCD